LSDDIDSQVKGMAALVLSSGRLSEFHEKNIKMYGLLYFECKEVKIMYDLSVRHDAEVDSKNNLTLKKPLQNCYVSYYFTMDDANQAANTNLDRRFDALEKSVRALLWNDLPVEIYFNNKIVYKSMR
jgi:hypothetical protein